jgi:hypothetical protein
VLYLKRKASTVCWLFAPLLESGFFTAARYAQAGKPQAEQCEGAGFCNRANEVDSGDKVVEVTITATCLIIPEQKELVGGR